MYRDNRNKERIREGRKTMYNIVKLIGTKKSNTKRQIVFVVFLCLLLMQILQLGSAIMSRDYISVPGYISDVNISDTGYNKITKKVTYEYTVHWTYEGQEYVKKKYSLNEKPDKNVSEVWIKKDNSDVMLYGSKELTIQTFIFGGMASIFFIIWLLMYKMSESIEYNEEVAENVLIAGVLGTIFSAIATVITTIAFNSEKLKGGDRKYTATVMLITALFFLAFCIVLSIMARKETKRLAGNNA